MARGSIGRERMLSGVVGISSHQPPATGHQEDLNNELLAVSFLSLHLSLFNAVPSTSDRPIVNSRRDFIEC